MFRSRRVQNILSPFSSLNTQSACFLHVHTYILAGAVALQLFAGVILFAVLFFYSYGSLRVQTV